MWKYLTFKWRRRSRQFRRNSHTWRLWLARYMHRHVYGSWKKLGQLRWMFLAWLCIVIVGIVGISRTLGSYDNVYLADAAARGGSYTEGMTGEVETINPIFATTVAENDITTLLFDGLTRQNPNGQIEPSLASRWDISADRKSYVFHLRDAVWHDGRPVTADDVAFTITAIQDPNTLSPLASNWKGVSYEVIDPKTIRFILPNTFSNFLAHKAGVLLTFVVEFTAQPGCF